MSSENIENVTMKALKRVMLFILGSGLLGNALYIYGLAYYQGYIEGLGFSHELFPIDWSDATVWTYSASRELGLSSLQMLLPMSPWFVLITIIAFYVVFRGWTILSAQTVQQKPCPWIRRRIIAAKKISRQNKAFRWLLFKPVRWLCKAESSFAAFIFSYFFSLFIFLLPLFIFIWAYFPLIGLEHGQYVAEKRLTAFKENLCSKPNSPWNHCITLKKEFTSDLLDEDITGRVLFKSSVALALYTTKGPMMISMPDRFLFITESAKTNADKPAD